jgi:hypothetical protein
MNRKDTEVCDDAVDEDVAEADGDDESSAGNDDAGARAHRG